MNNAFDRLIIRTKMAKESSISELEDASIETYQTEKRGRQTSKNCGTISKVVVTCKNRNSRKRSKRGVGEILGIIIF